MEFNKRKLIENRVINSKKQPLIVEILKTILTQEISDEEAQEIVFTIRQLVSVIVDCQYEQELKEKYKNENDFKQAA